MCPVAWKLSLVSSVLPPRHSVWEIPESTLQDHVYVHACMCVCVCVHHYYHIQDMHIFKGFF